MERTNPIKKSLIQRKHLSGTLSKALEPHPPRGPEMRGCRDKSQHYNIPKQPHIQFLYSTLYIYVKLNQSEFSHYTHS